MKLTHHEADILLKIGAAGVVSMDDVSGLMKKDLVKVEQGMLSLTKRGKKLFEEISDSDSYEREDDEGSS